MEEKNIRSTRWKSAMEKVILVINPNTSEKMTESIDESAQSAASGFRVITRRAEIGPETIEGLVARALCVPGMIGTAINEEVEFDAIVSACFGDPGVDVLQSLFDVPVLGIAESSLFIASRRAGNFSILTPMVEGVIDRVTDFVKKRGFGEKLHSIKCAPLSAVDTEKRSHEVQPRVINAARELVKEGSETIIMGCAGLGRFADLVTEQTGVPCIDPVKVGVQMAGIAIQYWNKNSKSIRPKRYQIRIEGYPSSIRKLYVLNET